MGGSKRGRCPADSGDPGHRAGFVAIVGRPNVGKSTLLNSLLGTKLAIVTPKPQTTRNRLLGIKTLPDAQILLLDTPGIHAARTPLNRRMVETALRSVGQADVVVLILSATGLDEEDHRLIERLRTVRSPVVAAVNKIDLVHRDTLLPLLMELERLLPGRDLVPVSALTGENLDRLSTVVKGLLPAGPPLYPAGQVTDQTERFIAQEIVREQLYLQTQAEVPYATAVSVERFEERPERKVLVIAATILVERPSQKAICLGHGGQRIKEIGRAARLQLEAFFDTRVFLELFVKVHPGWGRDPQVLADLGL